MTPEQQRIAVAEACGWKHRKYSDRSPQALWCNPDGVPIGFTPDYLNDLNAMHEAEKVLTPTQQGQYAIILAGGHGRLSCFFDMANKTAAQRAEAFLKTLNLYTT